MMMKLDNKAFVIHFSPNLGRVLKLVSPLEGTVLPMVSKMLAPQHICFPHRLCL